MTTTTNPAQTPVATPAIEHTVMCVHNRTPVDTSRIRTVIESKYLNSRNATLLMHRRDFAVYLHKETNAVCVIKFGQKKYTQLGVLNSITDLTDGNLLGIKLGGGAFVFNIEKAAVVVDHFCKPDEVYGLAWNMGKTVEDTSVFSVNRAYGTITMYCARNQWKPVALPIPEELFQRITAITDNSIISVDFVGPYNNRIVVTSVHPESTDPKEFRVKQFAFKYYRDYGRIGFLKASEPTNVVHTAVAFAMDMLIKKK